MVLEASKVPPYSRRPHRLYEAHVRAWSERATPQTTLWFWNTEIGWATVHPLLVKYGWEYRNCHIWAKCLQHVAGNANTKTQVALEPANLPDGGYPWRAVAAERAPLWHAPGTPSFSNVSATSVTISWEPNGIAPGTVYQLFRDGVMIWQGTATSVTDSNLTPNTTYRYKVAALNASGMPGAFTPEADVTTTAKITVPDTQEFDEPIPANGKLVIEGAVLVDFHAGDTSYSQIPAVPSNVITLRWVLDDDPEWIRYGTSLASMEPKQKFTPTKTLELTSGSGLKTIYAELSTGELYQQVVLVDREPPSVNAFWLGGASVTKPGGQATLLLEVYDNLFRPSDLQMSIDGGPWEPFKTMREVQLSGQGMRSVEVSVRDPAGNVAMKTLTIFVLP